VVLPILTFDERSLSPRFGYVFDATWLQPHESILGMLWKFVRANQLAAAAMVAQIGKCPTDGYSGLTPCPAEVDAGVVARLLGIRRAAVREGMLAKACTELAWCPRCLSGGYHSVVHQQVRQLHCPIHGSALDRRCACCGLPSVYRLDAQLLGSPYKCRHCRSRLCPQAGTRWMRQRRLCPNERLALTRARWS
jgi:hypothetical protein